MKNNNIRIILHDLDSLLIKIASNNNSIKEDTLVGNNVLFRDQVSYLKDEGLLFKTKAPVYCKLTQKGLILAASGGFTAEAKKKSFNRWTGLFYNVTSPTIAFLSLVALLFSIIYANNNQPVKNTILYNSLHIDTSFQNREPTKILYLLTKEDCDSVSRILINTLFQLTDSTNLTVE